MWLEQDVAAVRPDTRARGRHLPERTLAQWLDRQGLPSTMYTLYTFPRAGVERLRAHTAR
ncbi:hypothetical protein [Streptomyces sp. TP-A0356]|uniref:hypothetical protein n=1 Tax=Streptomyces sp. TP-A0356 TaxID=1359208 RepID=UPI0006E14E03|nr:hypothetical protein [Streptomyces sp. TP-A0356]